MKSLAVRIAAKVAVIMVLLVLFAPLSARPERGIHHVHKVKKPKVITAFLTFHNAKPRRKTCNSKVRNPRRITCNGKLQDGRMAAINRDKNHWLMYKIIIPIAYQDKKTGQKVFVKNLPPRQIADVMGPGPRSKPGYHIDYYLAGPVPAKYDKYNNTIWYFEVVY